MTPQALTGVVNSASIALRSRKATYSMQAFILTALIGVLFLPGSATAPAHVEASAPTAVSTVDEPSPKTAAIAAPAGKKLATIQEPATSSYTVKLTAYNAVPEQTDSDPGTTASGAASNSEVIAARSHDLAGGLPFGTVIAIYGPGKDTPSCNYNKVAHLIGYRVIADTTNARFTKRIDVELDAADKVTVDGRSINPGIALGVCSGVTVKVVGHIPLSRIPATQAELAKIFDTREVAINK
jgi:3D (Asp-Asp-Asp) domain-containing protein